MRGTDHPRGAAGVATPPARSLGIGDDAAFAALVEEHCGALLGYARMVTLDDGAAESAVRRAFATLRVGVEPAADLSLTLVERARASCLENIARRPAGAATDAGPEARLRAALSGIPVAQRDALALREVAGLSYDEIGAVTSRSTVSVAQLIWRGSGRLRSLLTGRPGGVSLGSRECERALTLLTLGEDRPLPDELAAGVQRHLAGCPHCPKGLPAIAGARAAYRRGARVRAGQALALSIATQSKVDQRLEPPAAGTVVVDARGIGTPAARRPRPPHEGRRRRRPLLPALASALALTATALAIELGGGGDDRANFARDATERPREAGTPPPSGARSPAGERPERGDAERDGPRPKGRRGAVNARETVAAAPARAAGATRPRASAAPAPPPAPEPEPAPAPGPAPPATSPPRPETRRPPDAPAPDRTPPAADPSPAPAPPAPGASPPKAPAAPAPAPAPVSARRPVGPPGLGGDVPPGHGGAPPGHSPGLPPGHGGAVLPPGRHGKPKKEKKG